MSFMTCYMQFIFGVLGSRFKLGLGSRNIKIPIWVRIGISKYQDLDFYYPDFSLHTSPWIGPNCLLLPSIIFIYLVRIRFHGMLKNFFDLLIFIIYFKTIIIFKINYLINTYIFWLLRLDIFPLLLEEIPRNY